MVDVPDIIMRSVLMLVVAIGTDDVRGHCCVLGITLRTAQGNLVLTSKVLVLMVHVCHGMDLAEMGLKPVLAKKNVAKVAHVLKNTSAVKKTAVMDQMKRVVVQDYQIKKFCGCFLLFH